MRLSFLICLFSPIGWFIPSIWLVFLSAFLISFVDGALLASINGDLQILVKHKHIADVFGNLMVWTQVGVVGGSLVVGRVTQLFGYEQGSMWVGFSSAILLMILTLIYYFLNDLLRQGSDTG